MKDSHLHAVPLWSRQWTSRCRRPRKLFYIDFLLILSRHDLPSASRRRNMLPCTEEEVFGPSRSPFLTSRRYTVWEWHKRSLRVNTRLQRESAINTIQLSSGHCLQRLPVVAQIRECLLRIRPARFKKAASPEVSIDGD